MCGYDDDVRFDKARRRERRCSRRRAHEKALECPARVWVLGRLALEAPVQLMAASSRRTAMTPCGARAEGSWRRNRSPWRRR